MLNYLRFALYGISTINTAFLGMSAFQYVFSTPPKIPNLAVRTGNSTPAKNQILDVIITAQSQNKDLSDLTEQYDARVTNFDLLGFMHSEEYLQKATLHFVTNVFNEIFNERHSNLEFQRLTQPEQENAKYGIEAAIENIFQNLADNENIQQLREAAAKFGKAGYNNKSEDEFKTLLSDRSKEAYQSSLSQGLNGYIVENYNKDVRHNNQKHSLISGGTLLLGLASAFVPNINDTVKIGVQCACFVAAIFATKHMDKVNSDLSTSHGIVR